MKRALTLFLCVLLTLCAQTALGEIGNKMVMRCGMDDVQDTSVKSLALEGGTLFILTSSSNIYTYDGALRAHALERGDAPNYTEFIALAQGEGAVWLLSAHSEEDASGIPIIKRVALDKLSLGAGGEIVFTDSRTLIHDQLTEYYSVYDMGSGGTQTIEDVRDICAPFILGGKLLFMGYDYDGYTAFVFDIISGDLYTLADNALIALAPYKGGEALIARVASDDTIDVSALNLDNGSTRALFTLDYDGMNIPCGFAYDSADDSVYYQLNGDLIKRAGASAAKTSSIPLDQWQQCLAFVTREGDYIASDYSTVLSRSTKADARASQKLTVHNPYSLTLDNAYYSFASDNANVDMRMVDDAGDIIRSALSQDDSVDVYYLPVKSREYTALYTRGYLAPLTHSKTLTDYAEALYPSLKDAITKNGELYAIPVELEIPPCLMFNRRAMEALDIEADALPETWAEFIEFLNGLESVLAAHPGTTLAPDFVNVYELKRTILGELLSDYVLALQRADMGRASADTRTLVELIKALERVNFDNLGVFDEQPMDSFGIVLLGETPYLLTGFLCPTAQTNCMNEVPLMLKFAADDAPMLDVNPYVLVINPYSKNQELATRFIERVTSVITPVNRIHMCPEYNEPVRNAYFDVIIEGEYHYLTLLEEQLANAKGADVAQIESLIDVQRESIEKYKEYNEYDASEKSIAHYREHAMYMVPQGYAGLDDMSSVELGTLISSYLDGAINAEALAKQLDEKVRMMMLEGY